MPLHIRHPEFRDNLETTKYPFGEKADLTNSAGDLILEGTFLDAHLYPIGAGARLYISSVVVEHSSIAIIIGDEDTVEVCRGTFNLPSPVADLRLVDQYDRPAGILVSEPARLAVFQSWGIGTHEFEIQESEFAATCCMPTPEIGVRAIVLEDGSLFTGQTWIVGDDGVVVRKEMVTLPGSCGKAPQTVPVIRIDVVGDPLFKRRLCDPKDLFNTPQPIKQIRVIDSAGNEFTCPPDEFGDMTIQISDSLASDTALRARQTKDGLILEVVGSVVTDTGG
jgi:hypothetical protein